MTVKNNKIIRNQLDIGLMAQKVASGVEAFARAAAQPLSAPFEAISTRAQELITTGKQATVRFFQDAAATQEKCRPVERLFASYQRDMIDLHDELPPLAQAVLQARLSDWRSTQLQRVVRGQEIEAFTDLNTVLATLPEKSPGFLDCITQVQDAFASHTTAPLALASQRKAGTLVGPASHTDTPVWTVDGGETFYGSFQRTAVFEYFTTGLEIVRPKEGELELVEFSITDDAKDGIAKRGKTYHVTTTEQRLPLPTALMFVGSPRSTYKIDPAIGRIYWSPDVGQYYLKLNRPPTHPQAVVITAYDYNSLFGYWWPKLTPCTAQMPAPAPNETIKAALSPFTRKIFDMAQHMGRRDLYGDYALTPYEQLEYAADRLKNSWTYDRQPQNLAAAMTKGTNWLGDLHQDGKVMTANCNVANTELAVAARAYGYPVRIVEGFAGNDRTLNTPGHLWVEARVGNFYRELDAQPGGFNGGKTAQLDDSILHKLHMIAAYDKNPKYRERDALYAQLPQHLDATTLEKLFDTLSALPLEEQRLDKLTDNQERIINSTHVGISQGIALDLERMDIYDRDPLQPNQQGRYRGYIITTGGYDEKIPSLWMAEEEKEKRGILEWHIDAGTPPEQPHQPLTLKTPLTPKALSGHATEGEGETLDHFRVIHVTIPSYPGRTFQVCHSVEEIQAVWNPLNKDGKSELVEGLQQLTFEQVRTEGEELDSENRPQHVVHYYAFNAKHGLLIDPNFPDRIGTDSHGKLWELQVSSDYTRILVAESVTDKSKEHTKHALKFAHAVFEHMQGRQISNTSDRGLLVRALTLILRHATPTRDARSWEDKTVITYILSEARRLNIRPEEIQETAAGAIPPTGPKAVVCDGIPQASTTSRPGCDEIWPESDAATRTTPITAEGLWVAVMRTIERDVYKDGFNASDMSPTHRAWMEQFIHDHFKPRK